MNIICDKTLLSAAIDGVSKAVTLRSTIPVLEGILLKAEGFQLTLTGYDLEMGIVTTIDANVKEPGEVVLNAKLLSSMVACFMPIWQLCACSAAWSAGCLPARSTSNLLKMEKPPSRAVWHSSRSSP